MTGWRRWLLIAVIAFAAAMGGVFAGRALLDRPSHTGAELHALLHDQLDLDDRQEQRLEALERGFAARRKSLEQELWLDNARLATAIGAERGYGPRVAEAVDASHGAMGRLQKETLEHVFAMRAILRPDQATKFDAAVVKALTTEPK